MWLPSLEVEAITYASYESATRMHILPALGGMLLPKITEFVLEEFFRRLPEGFVRV
ncbi:integrase [Eggerthella sp. YY7918]|nr:integrase [Eggerthella sp. YY7918]